MLECRNPIETYEAITLAHGGGGSLTQRLISEILLPAFDNAHLAELHDGAVFHTEHRILAMTTLDRGWAVPDKVMMPFERRR